jgi:hypothetical protein
VLSLPSEPEGGLGHALIKLLETRRCFCYDESVGTRALKDPVRRNVQLSRQIVEKDSVVLALRKPAPSEWLWRVSLPSRERSRLVCPQRRDKVSKATSNQGGRSDLGHKLEIGATTVGNTNSNTKDNSVHLAKTSAQAMKFLQANLVELVLPALFEIALVVQCECLQIPVPGFYTAICQPVAKRRDPYAWPSHEGYCDSALPPAERERPQHG